MELTGQLSCFILAVLLHIQLQAQLGDTAYIPTRCQCPKNEEIIQETITNFTITEKGPHCQTDEIIVTLKRENMKVCLSPGGRQGQFILTCWERINKDESLKKKCLRKKKPH